MDANKTFQYKWKSKKKNIAKYLFRVYNHGSNRFIYINKIVINNDKRPFL